MLLQMIYDASNPVAFSLGPLTVRWYGLAYLAAFALGAFILWRIGRRWKLTISLDDVLTVIIGVVIGAIVGGRLGYVIAYGDGYYLSHPLEIFMLSEGGMSFHGGLIGVVISGIISARITKIPFLTLADLGAIAAPLGLFFGRCANFINGELWGAVTDLPWGVVFGGSAGDLPRHPSQLYEAFLEGIVIFTVLYLLARRYPPRPRGTFFGLFLVLYGVFRIAVEFIREPDVQLGYLFGGWLTMGMVLSVPLILAGIGLLIYAHRRRLPQIGNVVAPSTAEDVVAPPSQG
jgi:phosphatidylglycerol---prolipoprotein diacylglyceryl transferase